MEHPKLKGFILWEAWMCSLNFIFQFKMYILKFLFYKWKFRPDGRAGEKVKSSPKHEESSSGHHEKHQQRLRQSGFLVTCYRKLKKWDGTTLPKSKTVHLKSLKAKKKLTFKIFSDNHKVMSSVWKVWFSHDHKLLFRDLHTRSIFS